MNRRLRNALAVTAVLGAGLLMTACGSDDDSAASSADSAPTAASSAASGQATPEAAHSGGRGGDTSAAGSGASASSDGKAAGSHASGSADAGADKSGYGQACGSNDISWSATSQSQAGGYYLIKAEAKPGVTCVIPAARPVVAFGSDGTEAGPAEQAMGQEIALRAGVAAYAGVSPKSTSQDGGKEFDSLIVSVSDGDPDPVSLNVGSFVEDKPVVTDWHTSAADAVPFAS